jgi:hypothetical protein
MLPAHCGDYCVWMWYYMYVVRFSEVYNCISFEKCKFDMMYILLQVLYIVMYLNSYVLDVVILSVHSYVLDVVMLSSLLTTELVS